MSERAATEKRTAPERRRRRIEAPCSARAVLRAVVERGVHAAPVDLRDAAGAARVARVARVEEAWRWAAEGPDEERGARVLSAGAVTLRYLRSSPGKALSAAEVARRLEKAGMRAARCGECGIVYTDPGRTLRWVMPESCRARVCFRCARSALRQRMDRWAPLTRAPLLPGYVASMVTVGSVGEVTDRAQVSGYLRRLARLARLMRVGDKRFGILPRSWVAGLRALELMPRREGGWAHAHMWVVRKAFVPYGLSEAKWWERLAGLAPDRAAALLARYPIPRRLPPVAEVLHELREAGHPPTPADLGMRALLRLLGIGEVFRDDILTSDGEGAAAVENYMSKVERYMSKVEADADGPASPWGGRADILAALRGVRLLEPWGDARGLLAGPDRVTHERDGRRLQLDRVGRFDPLDPETWWTLPDGAAEADEERRATERTTVYSAARLDDWAEWCDVAYLRRRLYTD